MQVADDEQDDVAIALASASPIFMAPLGPQPPPHAPMSSHLASVISSRKILPVGYFDRNLSMNHRKSLIDSAETVPSVAG